MLDNGTTKKIFNVDGRKTRRSTGAARVADEYIRTLQAGKLPNQKQIALNNGYSLNSAKTSVPFRTKTFKEKVFNALEAMEIERQRALELMKSKVNRAKYRDLVDSTDKLTRNIQLLSGKSTENLAIGLTNLPDSELLKLAEGEKSEEKPS